eukprot:5137041-Amphidinium_carterae.1
MFSPSARQPHDQVHLGIHHLDVSTLWLQSRLTDGTPELLRRPRAQNEADLGNKHLDRATMAKHWSSLGFYVATGSSALALQAAL